MKPTFRKTAIALALAGALGAVSASAFNLPNWLGGPGSSTVSTSPTPLPSAAVAASPGGVPLADARALVPDYRDIVKRFGPAVVGITVSGVHKVEASDGGADPEMDPFFQFFRGIPGMPGMRRGQPVEPFQGQGSGFVVSADGLILTNAHVVRDAKEVTVRLPDRREFAAKVLGADPVTDVALLKVSASNLPVVRLGRASEVEVGDRVLAIGAPYGLEQTATQGIISAKGRSLPGDTPVPFLQTDAAVNPGNSGGPLFAGNGEVVGINAQIYTRSGGFQGLSFAIPIDVALQVKDQILAHGKVEHARLGVQVQDLTQALADSFGLPSPDGAVVSQVTPGSAAARAGLKAGDVITQVGDKPVVRSGELSSLVSMAKPGDEVQLKVWRERGWKTLSARLGNAQDDGAAVQSSVSGGTDGTPQLGLALRNLNRSELRQLGVSDGLLVQDVDGAAQRAGIQPGDVVLAVNGQALSSVPQLRKQLAAHPKTIALLVLRDGQQLFVPIALS
jgi:serine protease Do